MFELRSECPLCSGTPVIAKAPAERGWREARVQRLYSILVPSDEVKVSKPDADVGFVLFRILDAPIIAKSLDCWLTHCLGEDLAFGTLYEYPVAWWTLERPGLACGVHMETSGLLALPLERYMRPDTLPSAASRLPRGSPFGGQERRLVLSAGCGSGRTFSSIWYMARMAVLASIDEVWALFRVYRDNRVHPLTQPVSQLLDIDFITRRDVALGPPASAAVLQRGFKCSEGLLTNVAMSTASPRCARTERPRDFCPSPLLNVLLVDDDECAHIPASAAPGERFPLCNRIAHGAMLNISHIAGSPRSVPRARLSEQAAPFSASCWETRTPGAGAPNRDQEEETGARNSSPGEHLYRYCEWILALEPSWVLQLPFRRFSGAVAAKAYHDLGEQLLALYDAVGAEDVEPLRRLPQRVQLLSQWYESESGHLEAVVERCGRSDLVCDWLWLTGLLELPPTVRAHVEDQLERVGGIEKVLYLAVATVAPLLGRDSPQRLLADESTSDVSQLVFALSVEMATACNVDVESLHIPTLRACLVRTRSSVAIMLHDGLPTAERSFALCHELSHLLLDHEPNTSYGIDASHLESFGRLRHFDIQEQEADALAALLLRLLERLVFETDSFIRFGEHPVPPHSRTGTVD